MICWNVVLETTYDVQLLGRTKIYAKFFDLQNLLSIMTEYSKLNASIHKFTKFGLACVNFKSNLIICKSMI